MAQDALGNEVTLGSDTTLSGLNDFVEGVLGYQARAVNILTAAENDPDCALAQTYAGIVALSSGTAEGAAKAGRWRQRATKSLGRATPRERMNFALFEAWSSGDIPKALALGEEIVDAFPTDLVALKIHQTLNFGLGNAPEMLRMARKALPANPDNPHLRAMLAFGYEECHFLDKAEHQANNALEKNAAEPWAHHALAHIMLTQGRVPEGRDFLKKASASWVGLNSFMYTHNWWHKALFDLSLGDAEAVFDAYDAHCWAMDKSFAEDQIGAVSLLARMEIAGLDVGQRWTEVGEHLRTRATDTLHPFTTLQYLYGLARAGRPEADTLMDAVRDRARSAAPFEKIAWQEVALPACEGLLAHARGQYQTAALELSRATPLMLMVGGSHAQRDLFAQILLDAHFKAGHYVTAQQMLESRRRYDPNGVPLNRMLAQTYEKLGLLDEAQTAAARHY